jgi:uncharacterized repeat protein (TIGR03803 family)
MIIKATFARHLLFTLTVLAVGIAAQAQTESVLYSFSGGSDGANPNGGLISDAAGNLYGTTSAGGNVGACGGPGCGVVFRLSPTSTGWKQTVLHAFTGGPDGANPGSGLIFGAGGNLYGTASAGGNGGCPGGCGVIFQLAPASGGWKEKVLYAFGGASDGFAPSYRLTSDAAGNLFGTTLTGGNLVNCASHTLGCGVAFKLARARAAWIFHVLYNFTDSDSSSPASALIFDAAGNLYGSGVAGQGGVVYQLSPAGGNAWTNTVLYTFNISNGYLPQGLTFDAAGNLYGPTFEGGTAGSIAKCQDLMPGCGTVFKLAHIASGPTESVLHNFTGQDSNPNGCLIFDVAGSLYGADSSDAFKLSRNSNGVWSKAVLHTFGGTGDGSGPRAPLLFDASGNLLGVTYQGGVSGKGAVFEIVP